MNVNTDDVLVRQAELDRQAKERGKIRLQELQADARASLEWQGLAGAFSLQTNGGAESLVECVVELAEGIVNAGKVDVLFRFVEQLTKVLNENPSGSGLPINREALADELRLGRLLTAAVESNSSRIVVSEQFDKQGAFAAPVSGAAEGMLFELWHFPNSSFWKLLPSQNCEIDDDTTQKILRKERELVAAQAACNAPPMVDGLAALLASHLVSGRSVSAELDTWDQAKALGLAARLLMDVAKAAETAWDVLARATAEQNMYQWLPLKMRRIVELIPRAGELERALSHWKALGFSFDRVFAARVGNGPEFEWFHGFERPRSFVELLIRVAEGLLSRTDAMFDDIANELAEMDEPARTRWSSLIVNENTLAEAWSFEQSGFWRVIGRHVLVGNPDFPSWMQAASIELRDSLMTPAPQQIEKLRNGLQWNESWAIRFKAGTGCDPVDEPEQWRAWGVRLFGAAVLGTPYPEIANLIYGELSRQRDSKLKLDGEVAIPNQKGGDGGESPGAGQVATDPKTATAAEQLPNAHRLAYLAATLAEQTAGRKMTDQETWNWLKENGIAVRASFDAYDLPSQDTFARYLSAARVAMGEPRKQKRSRSHGRSIANQTDL